ncbi:MAG: tetratricopeptide repeat protein [Planctomycetota bacterium]
MALRREPVLFCITAAVTALFGWSLYNAYNNPLQRLKWQKKDREVSELRVPDLKQLPAVTPPVDTQKKRDLFAAPRDTRPLAKLQLGVNLPPPEPDAYAWLMPPPTPAPGLTFWHLYLRVPRTVEKFEFTIPDAPAETAANGTDPQEPNAIGNNTNGTAAPPAATEAVQAPKPDDTVLAKRYDRLIVKEGPAQWGRIVNPKKYDLKDDEPITFQMYDIKTDKPVFKAAVYTRDQLLVPGYQLAKTIRNEIEIRKRKIAWLAGNVQEMRAFALWCIEQGDEEPIAFAEAERQLVKVLEFSKSDPINSLALGKLYEATYRYEKAWELYKAMTEGEFRATASAWVARAELERRLHLTKDAQASLDQAAKLEPNNYQPRLVLGEFYLSQKRPDLALEPLQSAMRDEPSGVEERSIRSRIRRRVGEAALAMGQLDAAAEAFDRAKKADETDQAAITGQAVVLWLKKQNAPALEILNTQIAAKPSAPALVLRGTIKLQSKDYLGAKQDYESAIGLDPLRDVRALSALAFLYLITDHREDAMQQIERALQNDPTDPYARYLRGRMRRDAGDIQGANDDQREAAMADLGFVEPLVELGALAAMEELYEPADRYYSKALEFDTKNADVLALRGLNLLNGGQVRRAIDVFLKSVNIQKDQPIARLGLGIGHYLDDNTSEMLKQLAAVRNDRPDGDKHKNYANQTFKLINIHELKEEMTEGFDRTVLNADWIPQRVQDVQMKILNGEYRIDGLFKITGEARLNYRKYRLDQFCSFEVDVKIPASDAKPEENQADITTYIRREEAARGGNPPGVAFEIAVEKLTKRADGTATVKLRFKEGSDNAWTRDINFAWPEDKAVRVKIEVNDEEKPKARVWLDQQVITNGFELNISRNTTGQLDLGVEAKGEQGNTASVSIDNVRIVKRTQP